MAELADELNALVIFTTRGDIETPCGGSSIRIAGYTSHLEEFGVPYIFVAPVRPPYVSEQRFEPFLPDKWLYRKIYAFLSTGKLRTLRKPLQASIDRHPLIARLLRLTENRLLWAHQTGLIPMYLAVAHGRRYIYDVHGILRLQGEYFHHTSLMRKAGLLANVWLEKKFFHYASYVNAASLQMKQYIEAAFTVPADSIIVTPEGLLENHPGHRDPSTQSSLRAHFGIQQNDRVIFFAGDFKKIGGVHLLTEVFCRLALSMENLKLFLVGSGQMEQKVLKTIRKHRLSSRVIHLPRADYRELPALQQLSDLIVCPDLYNRYNEMVAHIKVFDSLAAQKPVLASRFPVLLDEFPELKECIRYFEASNSDDLERAIRDTLERPEKVRPLTVDELRVLTYRQRVKGVINEYRRRKIIHG